MVDIKSCREDEIKSMLCNCEDITNVNGYFCELNQLGENLREDMLQNKLLKFLNALGNIERLIIFSTLKEKDRCVCELEAILKKSQSSISHHLRILEETGVIKGWKKGKFTYYGIENDIVMRNLTQFIEFLGKETIINKNEDLIK
ncbi:MAG: ArsR family transcriptional regulator [Promethearchaeota archaeon]|nr:MAG: ArsR family transcriptional regulator [Candidatus Lokiarchaeota archaeon]